MPEGACRESKPRKKKAAEEASAALEPAAETAGADSVASAPAPSYDDEATATPVADEASAPAPSYYDEATATPVSDEAGEAVVSDETGPTEDE